MYVTLNNNESFNDRGTQAKPVIGLQICIFVFPKQIQQGVQLGEWGRGGNHLFARFLLLPLER